MRRAILTVVLATASTSASAELPGITPDRCGGPAVTVTDANRSPNGVRKLGEMPPVSQILTVLQKVDGCPVPVVLRRSIGAAKGR